MIDISGTPLLHELKILSTKQKNTKNMSSTLAQNQPDNQQNKLKVKTSLGSKKEKLRKKR